VFGSGRKGSWGKNTKEGSDVPEGQFLYCSQRGERWWEKKKIGESGLLGERVGALFPGAGKRSTEQRGGGGRIGGGGLKKEKEKSFWRPWPIFKKKTGLQG